MKQWGKCCRFFVSSSSRKSADFFPHKSFHTVCFPLEPCSSIVVSNSVVGQMMKRTTYFSPNDS